MIGEMNKIIQLQNPSKTQTEAAGHIEVYDVFLTTRGKANRMSSYRTYQAGYDMHVEVYEFELWNRGGIEANLQKDTILVYDNREFKYQTHRLENEERGKLIIIEAMAT